MRKQQGKIIQVLQKLELNLLDEKQSLSRQFNNLVNTDIPKTILVPDTLYTNELPYPQEVLLDSIIYRNPMTRSYEYSIRADSDLENLASKRGMPGVSLGIDYITIGKNKTVMNNNAGKDALIFPKIGFDDYRDDGCT